MQGKLYYQDPYITQFTTDLVENCQDETGQWYVILEETAFYPTGGGQPHDIGTIEKIEVIDVEEINGEIRHYLEKPLPKEVQVVCCELNWTRRFDHMQQHSGQHILSAAFAELFGYQTVSFHLGKDSSTIDLDIENLPNEDAGQAEKKANKIVMDAREIDIKWVTYQELNEYPLRKKPTVSENIRLVIIPDFDYNGCGGTHPRNTAETGPVKILGWEKQRKKIRVEFICGNRVLNQFQEKHKDSQQLSSLLNANEKELPTAVQRLLDEKKSLEKSLEEAQATLLEYEANGLIRAQPEKLIAKVFSNRNIQELQKLARYITATAEDKVSLFVAENEEQLQVVCAKGPKADGNMKELMLAILPSINGKGGGNATFAQGGGMAMLPAKQLLQILVDHETSMRSL